MINNPRASGSETPSPRYCWEKGGRQKGTTGAVRAASRMFEFFHIFFACHVGGEELRTSGMQAYSDSSLQGQNCTTWLFTVRFRERGFGR